MVHIAVLFITKPGGTYIDRLLINKIVKVVKTTRVYLLCMHVPGTCRYLYIIYSLLFTG